MNDMWSDYDSDSENSDRELQVAFAKGLLKPGLNREVEKRSFPLINNVDGLENKMKGFSLLPWGETLDLTVEPAPLAPEIALEISERSKDGKEEIPLAKNDFAREMLFYRLGQAAVLKAIPKLQSLGIPTTRPDDYFAEMCKSDEHMHKVREKLHKKETDIALKEKTRKLRDLKKFGKKVQAQKLIQKQSEKRKVLDHIKKYRKGKVDDLN